MAAEFDQAFSGAFATATVGATVTDWTTVPIVKSALGLDPADAADDAWLDMCVAAVNRYVDTTRPAPADQTGWVAPIPADNPDTVWGATQLATRWYSRRNSSDISAFVELGGPPPSIDRDIEVSLRLGRYFAPAVA